MQRKKKMQTYLALKKRDFAEQLKQSKLKAKMED